MTKYTFPEQIDHRDSTQPLLDGSETKGGYKIVADASARNLIPIAKREIGSLVTIGTTLKQYKGASVNDIDWINDANWEAFSNAADFVSKTVITEQTMAGALALPIITVDGFEVSKNTEDNVLQMKLNSEVSNQLGTELNKPIVKTTVNNIANGKLYRLTTVDGATNQFSVELSDNSSESTAYVDGMATQEITSGGGIKFGTSYGKVRGLNTAISGAVSGGYVYLGTNGDFQATEPAYPSKVVIVGKFGRIHATEGWIDLTVSSVYQNKFNQIDSTLELRANQFTKICSMCPILPNDIVIDTTALTISVATIKGGQTISASNPIRVFTDGSGMIYKHEFSTAKTANFTNTTGRWFVYFAQNGTFTCSQTEWNNFNLIAPVFIFDWDATLSGAARLIEEQVEMHLNTISADDHTHMHFGDGTIHLFGGELIRNELTTGSPNVDGRNTCISLTSCTSMDDNYIYTTTNTTPNAPVNYFEQDLGHVTAGTLTLSNAGQFPIRTNAGLGGQRSFLPATRFPFKWNTSNNRPQYITSAGVATDVVDDRYFVYYVYQLQDRKVGQSIRIVSAETDFTTITLAKAHQWETLQTLHEDLRNPENRLLYKLIFFTNSGGGGAFSSAVKYTRLHERIDLRKGKYISGGVTAGGTVVATNVTTLAKTVLTATNVESSLLQADELFVRLTKTIDLGTTGGTVTINAALGKTFIVTMDANSTFDITNPIAGQEVVIYPTGAFTTAVTSSGVTINPITVDTYVSAKSRIHILFITATTADMYYINID